MVTPASKREAVNHLKIVYSKSERKGCKLIGISRRTYKYEHKKKDDFELIDLLLSLAERFPNYGFWKLYKREFKTSSYNHKRVYRVYKQLGLHIRKKVKRRLPARVKSPIEIPTEANEQWSMDFMHDRLYDGRKVRLLNIIDHYNRELIAIEVGQSMNANRVVQVLERLKNEGRTAKNIRVDNGPEFISKTLVKWAQENSVQLDYIQPGKPTQNAIVERLNRSCREELLNAYIFDSYQQIEQMATSWQYEYNNFRPHDALSGLSPIVYKNQKKVA